MTVFRKKMQDIEWINQCLHVDNMKRDGGLMQEFLTTHNREFKTKWSSNNPDGGVHGPVWSGQAGNHYQSWNPSILIIEDLTSDFETGLLERLRGSPCQETPDVAQGRHQRRSRTQTNKMPSCPGLTTLRSGRSKISQTLPVSLNALQARRDLHTGTWTRWARAISWAISNTVTWNTGPRPDSRSSGSGRVSTRRLLESAVLQYWS